MSFCLLMMFTLAGCAPYVDKSGTRHYIVIGFGIVSVSKTNDAVQVVKNSSLGVEVQSRPFKLAVGADSTTEIAVKTNANVSVELESLPLKPMKVDISR